MSRTDRPTSFVQRAQELGPQLRAASAEIEAKGSLTDDVVSSMRDAGLFRLWVPATYGGHETPVDESLDALIELGRHDGSASWSAMIANTTALFAAHLPEQWGREIFGSPESIAGGFAQPRGEATVVEGGLRVSGQWQWGSFTRHATMVAGGVQIAAGDGGKPRRGPFAFFDPEDVEWVDNWQVMGLRGTGSSDYRVTDAFVPEGRWVDLAAGEPLTVDAPLYRFSIYGLLAVGVSAAAVGITQRAIEEFIEVAVSKTPQNSSRTLAERPATQTEVARAEAAVASSVAFLHDAIGVAWNRAESGDSITAQEKRMLRLAATDATQRCADVVARLYRTAGGEAVYERCPLEKLFRDVNVATQHAMVSERIYETVGRIPLRLETNTALL